MLKGPNVQFICLLAYILLIFNNMIKNIGPDGDSAHFSAIYKRGYKVELNTGETVKHSNNYVH